jgi:exodeoxyribonuclease V beta subunit
LKLLDNDAPLRREVVNDFWRRRVAGGVLSDTLSSSLLAGKDSPDTMDRLLQRRLARPLSLQLWPDEIDNPPPLDLAPLRAAHAAAKADWQRRKDNIVATVRGALDQLNKGTYNPSSLQAAQADWERLLFADDPLPTLPGKFEKIDLLGTDKLAKFTKNNRVTPRDPFFVLAQTLLDARAEAIDAAAVNRLSLLKTLIDEGSSAMRALKLRQRVVAFDDMLFNLYQRLGDGRSAWLAAALRERFPAALIDEFQDTDPLQFAIFERIYFGHGAPLFFVGDPKQAIYSFRNADLHTYLGARRHAGAEHSLASNQRSSPELIDALNTLFTRNRSAFMLPGLDYRPVGVGDKPRSVFVDRSAPRAALHVWMLPVDDSVGLKKDDALAAASRACAAEIARLLQGAADGEVALDGRPLRAGDIAVLVRTHRQGNLMRDALRCLHIGPKAGVVDVG